MIRPLRTQPRNDFPSGDGKPMAESDLHRDLMSELIGTLKWWFRDKPDVYVSGNLLVFYEPGNKRRHVSPDVFVVPGVGGHTRENYLMWEEGRGLDFVIETTSKTTRREDEVTKYNLYVERLAVKEYVLFDPTEDYLRPPFQMFRRHGTGFRPVKPTDGRFTSRVLGLELERVGATLRLIDPATGERVPTPGERATAEAERADVEALDRRPVQQPLAFAGPTGVRQNQAIRQGIARLRKRRRGKIAQQGHRLLRPAGTPQGQGMRRMGQQEFQVRTRHEWSPREWQRNGRIPPDESAQLRPRPGSLSALRRVAYSNLCLSGDHCEPLCRTSFRSRRPSDPFWARRGSTGEL